MLGHDGRLKGDLTCFNWENNVFWIMGSYYLREWHLRWFHDHLPGGIKTIQTDGEVSLQDITNNIGGYAISGSNSRKLLERLTNFNVSNENLKFMSCNEIDIGLIKTKIARLSVAGELSYEINCHALELNALIELLISRGKDLGFQEYGYYALNTLRLEKSFGIWNCEFMQAYTPGETGLNRWISRGKNVKFIGQTPALKELSEGKKALQKTLITLEIKDTEVEANGFEPICSKNNKRIGMTTSGGYGYNVNKLLAMAFVETEFSEPGMELKTHIVGKEKHCVVLGNSPWDPDGYRMRS